MISIFLAAINKKVQQPFDVSSVARCCTYFDMEFESIDI